MVIFGDFPSLITISGLFYSYALIPFHIFTHPPIPYRLLFRQMEMAYDNTDPTVFAFSAALARRPSLAPFHAMTDPYDHPHQPLSGPVLAGINRRPSDDSRTRAACAQISPMLLHPHAPVFFQQQPFDSQSAFAEVEALYAEFFEPQQPLEPEGVQMQPVLDEQQWAQYSLGTQPAPHAFIASSPPPPLDFSATSPAVEPMPCSPVHSRTSHADSTRWKMYEPTAQTFYTPDSPVVVSGAFSAPSPIAVQPTFEVNPSPAGMKPTVAPIAIPAPTSRSATPNGINTASSAESLDDEDRKFMQKRVIPSISAYKRLHGRGHRRDLSAAMSIASDDGTGSGYSSAGVTPLMKDTLLAAAPACVSGEKRKRPEGEPEGEADGEGEMALCEEVVTKDTRSTSRQSDALQTHYHVFSIHSPQLHFSDSAPIFMQSHPSTHSPDVDSAEDSDAFISAPHSDDDDDEFRPVPSYLAARGSKKLKNGKAPCRPGKRPRINSPMHAPIIVDYEISDYITPGTTSCPICGHEPSGSRLSDLRRHLQTHKKDGQRRMWACRKCSRVVKDQDGKVIKVVGHTAFVRCDSLKRHWGREHIEE